MYLQTRFIMAFFFTARLNVIHGSIQHHSNPFKNFLNCQMHCSAHYVCAPGSSASFLACVISKATGGLENVPIFTFTIPKSANNLHTPPPKACY